MVFIRLTTPAGDDLFIHVKYLVSFGKGWVLMRGAPSDTPVKETENEIMARLMEVGDGSK